MHDPRDGLGEDARAGVGVQHGEDSLGFRRGGAKDKCAVVAVEGRGKDGPEGEEVGVGRERGEVLESGGVDLLAEGEDGGVWEGGDVVRVDDEEGVGGLNYCPTLGIERCGRNCGHYVGVWLQYLSLRSNCASLRGE